MTNSPQADLKLDPQYVTAKLRRNLPAVLGFTFLCLVAGLLYAFFDPPKYRVETTLYFPSRPSNVLGGVGVASLEGNGALGGLGGGPSSLKIFRRFLESETCLAFVSEQTNVPRKKIEASRSFVEDAEANMLTLAVALPDQQLARRIIEEHLKALDSINRKISTDYMQDDTFAIQSELKTQRAKLDRAEADLVEFQKHANSAPSSSPSQWESRLLQARVELGSVKSSVKAASSLYHKSLGSQGLSPSDIPPVQKLRPKLVDAQYQLNVLNSSLGPDSPEVRHLTTDIKNLKDELKSEVSAYVSSVDKGLIDPTAAPGSSSQGAAVSGMLERQVSLESEIDALSQLAKVAPSEQGTLAHLTLQVSIQSDLVRQATLQLEAARLQSLRDPNKWSLLDPPWVDPKPVNKKYFQISLFAIVGGLLLSCIWAINFGRKPTPQ